MSDNNWRHQTYSRTIVYSCCWLLVATPAAPLYAAPPANALPQIAPAGVSFGRATINTAGSNMTINQSTNKAILNWNSFNIGKDAKVQFNQPSINSTALNLIQDSSATQIFGQLSANGNVYLINNNGILFGEGAQINVHGLVASTLNVDTNQFVNASLATAIDSGKAAFAGGTAVDASVVVAGGANITTDSGGQVLMFAPTVVNGGTIATPDGQTVLAASHDKVYLATSNNDPNLRGLLVEVETGGNVTNVGRMVAERGNITLLGLAVNQSGRMQATTSVDVNGSIRLLARDRAQLAEPSFNSQSHALMVDESKQMPSANALIPIATRTGTVKVGAGSVTEVVADSQPGAAPDAQVQNKSRIDVMAQNIAVGDNATLAAKSGRITLVATEHPAENPTAPVQRTASRITIGKNATLDVSGENVELPMERRLITVELRGDELKDAPLQRNGVLRNKKVIVDVATGSPLIADLQPSIATVKKGVRERMSEGGTINLRSQGEVVFSENSRLDMKGGSITYAPGMINTSKLVTKEGWLVDIGSADPNWTYAGVLGEHTETHEKWGPEVFGRLSSPSVGVYVDKYTEGRDGGLLNIDAQALYGFDLARIEAGVRRGTTQRTPEKAPEGGAIAITLGAAAGSVQEVVLDEIARSATDFADGATVPDTAYLSAAAISASGAGSFSLRANGHVDVKSDATVTLKAGSKFSLTGTSIDFNGKVRSPSGSVALATVAPVGAPGASEAQPLRVGTGSSIDVSGSWTNDVLGARQSPELAPLALNGGSIALSARGDVDIEGGSELVANAGAQLTSGNAFKGGNGGSIRIATNARSDTDRGSVLTLGGRIEAYGYAQGGKLAVEANGIQLGGERGSDPRTLHIDPLFLTEGGFADYTFTANMSGLEVAAGTVLAPVQKNLQPGDVIRLALLDSAASMDASLISPQLLADNLRNPVDLHLNAVQTLNRTESEFGPAYLRVGEGAQIKADNGARIDLSTTGDLYVNGGITARGGAINLAINATPRELAIDRGYRPDQAIWLGSKASLDASATIERAVPGSQLVDKVFDAGSIKLTAERGFIVAEPGSVLDVSAGQSYSVALPIDLQAKRDQQVAVLNPAAGSIAFTAAEGIASFATLRGEHSGDGRAGSLSYLLDGNNRIDDRTPNFDFVPLTIDVAQSQRWSELAVGDSLTAGMRGRALVATDDIAKGGFGSLDLSVRNKKDANNTISNPGRIVFGSDVSLELSDSLVLGSTNIDVADHSVLLKAATATLGSDFWESGGASQVKEDTGADAGTGSLTLAAKALDVVGNIGIKGSAENLLRSAGDLRLRAVVDGTLRTGRALAAAELTTPGNLTLQATQIYPTTLSDYTVRLGGTQSVLRTLGNDGVRTPVFSAGGKLTLKAPTIEHEGVLAAPLGTIALDAGKEIHLAAGSSIDVSAHDLLIPFGRLRGGELNWIYPILADEPLVIARPPEKSVALTAPSTRMDKGATVDLSGGGDIYAFEQIPGPGGSKDFLDVANAKGAFAVLPTLAGLTSPHDTVEMQGTGIATGDTVWLDGSSGLPAGNYAVLPAHYALLPGAYLITPQSGSSPVASLAGTRADGIALVSGRLGRGLSGQYDAGYQRFAVETGAAVRARSEYKEMTGAQFYADKKVDLAADAGHMTVVAETALALEGSINAAAKNGRGAQLDIVADRIAVVADAAEEVGAGVVKLVAASLNGLGIDSLMLGGKRSRAGDDTAVEVFSSDVQVTGGAALAAPDVILAARDNIAIAANASVSGSGKSTVNTRAFVIDGDGALLRTSSGQQSNVIRTNSSGVVGDLRIDALARLSSTQSMLLDASGTMALPGQLLVNGGALNISTNRISLGDVPQGTSGVALNNAQLSGLQAQTLRLSSRSSLDFFGDVTFINQQTEFNAPVLRNMAEGTVRIDAADTLRLENGVNSLALDGSAVEGGRLILSAKNIALGREGDAASAMRFEGFDQVQLGSQGTTHSIRGAGDFTLRTHSLAAYADRLIAGSTGAKTQLLADGSVVLNSAGAAVPAFRVDSALGGDLTIKAENIALGTRIEIASGSVALEANGAAAGDNVALRAGGVIDVGGRSIATQHSTMNTSGGTIKLASVNGDVTADAGSTVNIGGGSKGGDAGILQVSAVAGKAQLAGAITAAHVAGQRGASLAVDVGSLNSTDALLALVASSGIDHSVNLRARSGDVAIGQNLRAANIGIAADAGALSLSSVLDASGAEGGHVALYARDDLRLSSGARIDARATSAPGRGGHVELGSTAGALRLAGNIAVGGGVDGRDGKVDLRVTRSVDNTSVPVFNNGIAIAGAERVQLAGVKSYDSSVLDSSLLDQARLDAIDFMANEATIKAGLGTLVTPEFHLVPEIEVRSSGDLTVTSAVNFVPDDDGDFKPDTTWRFGAALEAPVITLRAAGNLDVTESLSDGIFDYKDPRSRVARLNANPSRTAKLLLAGDSASFRLVAGAALDAANPDAVGASGNITVANGSDVVTGTGSVLLAAGGNIVVDSANSLIASLGRTDYSDYATPYNSSPSFYDIETLPDTGTFNAIWATIIGSTLPQYPHQGGDVAMRAGGDISYAAPTKFFSSWLQRVSGEFKLRATATNPAQAFNLTEWGAMLNFLSEGVVALGGGDVDIAANGSISNLNAALPSSGKQVGVGVDLVEITRSGNLTVTAGRNILSPRLLVDNGRAELRAGNDIGRSVGVDPDTGETVTGLHTVAVLGDSTLLLRANGDIGIDAVFNSTVMPLSRNQTQTPANSFLRTENYFFTYGDTAAVNIESVRGDVAINNDSTAVLAAFNNDLGTHSDPTGTVGGGWFAFGSTPNIDYAESQIFALYPGKLSVSAAAGDIDLNRDLFLFPKADGQLSLLAGGNIRTADNVRIRVSDADPAALPSLYHSERMLATPNLSANSTLARLFGEGAITHSSEPVHQADKNPSIIDAAVDILSGFESLFEISEATWVAARDIVSLNIAIQNNRKSDVSEVVAQRDIVYPLTLLESGALQADNSKVQISGPGRLDVIAGRNVELGTSQGLISNGNQDNANLPEIGADISVFAGINGATALTDPTLFNAFVDNYLKNTGGPAGTFIEWFSAGSFTGDTGELLTVFTGRSYTTREAALTDFAALPVLTQQAIALEAWRSQRLDQITHAAGKDAYAQFTGPVDVADYSVDLIDFVSFDRFGGDLRAAVSAVTNASYASNEAAAIALAKLPAAQQHQVARSAFVAAPAPARRELLTEVFFAELRQGGVEHETGLVTKADRDGFERSYAAIERMFPGKQWQGDISLVFSALRTFNGGDINFYAPGGGVDVGLAGKFAGFEKDAGQLGIITQRYGAINGFAHDDISINQSRISSLDGAGTTLFSTVGDIDAGRGAKTALSIPPPTITINDDGSVTLVFDPAIAGSGVQSANNATKAAADRGPLLADPDGVTPADGDSITDRDRFWRGLADGTGYLFAPNGAVNAGDAGISVSGDLFIAAQQVIGADNINVGGVSVGVPTSTSISAGTLSLGDVASAATESATGSMNDAIRDAAAALSEGNVAFVTVDILGVGP